MTNRALSIDDIRTALTAGQTVSVPYHVEGYGPGRTCHSYGRVHLGEANGPEGWLRVGYDADTGALIIDEWDTATCPEALHGAHIDAALGGRIIVDEILTADIRGTGR